MIRFEAKQALPPAGVPILVTNHSQDNKTFHLAAVTVAPAGEPG